ncbi:tRNA uridine-5-carboxymethylaminomethyl(34) synthesis GTPase MnmE [Rhizorhabdus dicambivorans]|uniref:tRNA modification GTPase MnmE n=1 Tax=Rhizorhabdus dicambivorans TaxID=1850238 RepID=A0A2A4G0H9_9SPHN|nr:tRNA uridine-5-carboxymethylaminomethyl(34) synthesis GTPase MnmE [Rhizorhabdus dicambivorans]ATE63291.1 tRNA uridine-5-carboxymethylaminomethyl(34) synthesis GTPase MnmE [Rhizorhabdus dicambivorans]PCE43505.1 tRNA uridine-5-carboxymethylaminomethyl(34) synthesis GTPase MnmE [Rhizorhabdus dicambivorans]
MPAAPPANNPATIFALSSGAPPAGVAVVRISGPAAGETLDRLTGRARPEARRAVLRTLTDPTDGHALDRALLLWLPGPASATGEDMAELHLHGGRAVTASVLGSLARLPGLRPAEPGEFTRRAFENGRIDLNEAEALADLLAAETESQRRNAMMLAGGALSRALEDWQGRVLAMSARLEAEIDFSDEDDVAPLDPGFAAELAALAGEVARWRGRVPVERLRDGIRVVLAGPPNAGKSTLLNALAGREAAIVTPIAGTTRDLIEAPVSVGGIPFLLIDTAGLHEGSGDAVEAIGIDRATQAMMAADLLLWLGDPAEAPAGAIRVGAQADRLGRDPAAYDLLLSARTGEGLDELIALLVECARVLLPAEGEAALSARQRIALDRLGDALELGRTERDPILIAEALRLARVAIDALTGRAGTEDMLDGLFGRFCIGK